MQEMSREEVEGGWRDLYVWGLGIGALLAVAVVGAAYFAKAHKADMEDTAQPALIDGIGLGAVDRMGPGHRGFRREVVSRFAVRPGDRWRS
jgi:hypothetical protein